MGLCRQSKRVKCLDADGNMELSLVMTKGEDWRRERDSNPRYPKGYNGFRDRRLRPLSHLSAKILLNITPFSKNTSQKNEIIAESNHFKSKIACLNPANVSGAKNGFTSF